MWPTPDIYDIWPSILGSINPATITITPRQPHLLPNPFSSTRTALQPFTRRFKGFPMAVVYNSAKNYCASDDNFLSVLWNAAFLCRIYIIVMRTLAPASL
ncbi:hypothetical protein CRM22_007299 [Opisthorchis felineus]|uniref:Uncharacterized protein n=1 Tax=Opisthorchis felineus TaxID=147828 RepID=A0A4S2LH08_OPIFE|nr:hypothetical protein CRM22_007299 [Opisthorchis felineus]